MIAPVLGHKGGPPDPPLQFARSVAQCLAHSTVASGYSESVHPWQPDWQPVGPRATRPEEAEQATVVTFFPHPQEFFSGQSWPLLTPLEEKTLQLAHLGIDQLVLLPFNRTLAALSAEDFVEQVLIRGLQARQISVGCDFRFGKDRSGDVDLLAAIATRHHIPVTRVPLKQDGQGRISSSRIRQALRDGNLAEATRLLGRPYTLTGRVVHGRHLGRELGFPTANLKLPADKYLPRQGVYRVQVCGVTDPPAEPRLGVMNIGYRPTVSGQDLSLEVHLLNWSGDLYGRSLTVSLEDFLRPEQTFNSLDDLKAQIEADCRAAALPSVIL